MITHLEGTDLYELEHRGETLRVSPGPDLRGVWISRDGELRRFVPAEDPALADVLLRCGFIL